MEEKHGVKGNTFENIFFTEDNISSCAVIKHLHVEISRQNSNLLEVKKSLAREATILGANALSNFRYGQKQHEWWKILFTFKWDTESWHGEGDALKI